MIADEAAVFHAGSTAKSSSGVMKPAPSPDPVNKSKVCPVARIKENEIPVVITRGITIAAKSSAIGKTRIQTKRICDHSRKLARSHGISKKIHVEQKFVFDEKSKTAGIILHNKSSKEITIATDTVVAKVLDDDCSTRTKAVRCRKVTHVIKSIKKHRGIKQSSAKTESARVTA